MFYWIFLFTLPFFIIYYVNFCVLIKQTQWKQLLTSALDFSILLRAFNKHFSFRVWLFKHIRWPSIRLAHSSKSLQLSAGWTGSPCSPCSRFVRERWNLLKAKSKIRKNITVSLPMHFAFVFLFVLLFLSLCRIHEFKISRVFFLWNTFAFFT